MSSVLASTNIDVGLRIRLTAPHDLTALWQQLWAEAIIRQKPADLELEVHTTEHGSILMVEGRTWLGPTDQATVALELLQLVNRAVFTHAAGTHVHAAGAVRAGVGVLLVGPSGAGKSTLTADLLANYWQIVNDELVTIGTENIVTSFPKPITLNSSAVPSALRSLPLLDEAAIALGRPSWVPSIEVRHLVRLRYDPAGPDELCPIRHSTMVADLLTEMLSRPDSLEELLVQLVALVAPAACWEMRYRSSRGARTLLETLPPTVPRARVDRIAGLARGVCLGSEVLAPSCDDDVLVLDRETAEQLVRHRAGAAVPVESEATWNALDALVCWHHSGGSHNVS